MLRISIIFLSMILLLSCLKVPTGYIVADIPPICSISKYIIKDRYEVYCLMKDVMDIHHHDINLKPLDFYKLRHAKYCITIGYYHDLFKNSNCKIINVSKGIKIKEKDIHIWLSPKNGYIIARNIKESLPDYIDYKRYNEFVSEMKLYEEIINKIFKNCKKNIIITLHPILSYLIENEGIKIIYIRGSDHFETSFERILKLYNLIRKENITYILKEKGLEFPESNFLAERLKVKVLEIDIIGNSSKYSYVRILDDIVKKLSIALECDYHD